MFYGHENIYIYIYSYNINIYYSNIHFWGWVTGCDLSGNHTVDDVDNYTVRHNVTSLNSM